MSGFEQLSGFELYFWVVVSFLFAAGVVAIVAMIVAIVGFLTLVGIHFWVKRLIYTIRPQHCRRCGKRFSATLAYYESKYDFICVVCRIVPGPV